MKPRTEPAPALKELARAQAGVVSIDQAMRLGLTRHSVARLVATGGWRRIATSVLFVHDLEPPWLALAWAGVLMAGAGSRVGAEAAAALHGLTEDRPDQIVIMIPHSRRLRDRPPWTFRRERAGVRSARSVGTLPRTTVEDTVLDLCVDERATLHWISEAVRQRKTSVPRLRSTALTRTRLPHRPLVLAVLADTRSGAESPLEVRYLRAVERAHGLPRGQRQVRRRNADRNDVGYETYGLVVELDGHLGHDGVGRFRDFRRDNDALLAGRVTLRYGWDDVTRRPCALARQVAEVLIRRGWPGLPTACRACARASAEIGEHLAG